MSSIETLILINILRDIFTERFNMPSKNITIDFSPNDTVFHVTEQQGIREGTVVHVQVVDNSSETIITYYVRYTGQTNTTPVTTGLYADLGSAQVGTAGGGALEAYETILTT